MSPSHAGPFQKSARSCHWCYFSCSGTMCSTMGGHSFTKIKIQLASQLLGHLLFALPPQDLSAIYLQAFSSSPKFLGWLYLLGKFIFTKLHSGASVNCLRSYCQPFRTLGQRKKSSPHLWLLSFFPLFFSTAVLLLCLIPSLFLLPLL